MKWSETCCDDGLDARVSQYSENIGDGSDAQQQPM